MKQVFDHRVCNRNHVLDNVRPRLSAKSERGITVLFLNPFQNDDRILRGLNSWAANIERVLEPS